MPVLDVLLQHADVGVAHQRRRSTSRAFGRQSACLTKIGISRSPASTSLVFVFLSRVREQDALVGHAGPVVDAVVDREPVAQVLEHRAAASSGRSSGTAG